MLEDLSQKKSVCSGVEHDADTRDGLAGLWLYTVASRITQVSYLIFFYLFYLFTLFAEFTCLV